MLLSIFQDGLFAAIAAIGFSAISNPPKVAFCYVAVIAAVGHCTRFVLMNSLGWNIIPASFIGAIVIGLCSVLMAPKAGCVPETFSYPSLLPMIPGVYAYKCIQALGVMSSAASEEQFMHYTYLSVFNGFTAVSVILAMFIGQLLPVMMFKRIVFSATKGNLTEDY